MHLLILLQNYNTPLAWQDNPWHNLHPITQANGGSQNLNSMLERMLKKDLYTSYFDNKYVGGWSYQA